MKSLRFLLVAVVLAPVAFADLAADADAILEKNCRVCHGAAMQQSGLDLRTREKILQGGERGAGVVPHNLRGSWIWRLVSHAVKPEMPPGSKLPDADLETLRKWIEAGAPLPEKALTDEEAAKRAALAKLEERPITEQERQWWAFQPPAKVEPPAGAANPIDGFLDAALAANGLEPAPEADKRRLVRRDLPGLDRSSSERPSKSGLFSRTTTPRHSRIS